ncbi:MAG: LacI family DNA-binding transcriptional regulator [Pseudomonadota bacterium]
MAENSTPASIKDVARIAGVSIATVSRCINQPDKVREKTRIKVQNAIIETGYSPNTLAQSFRRGRTQMVMVVLPSVGDPFFTEVMAGIRTAASAKGYSLLINETQFNTMTADEIGRLVVSKQADGIILLASMSPFGTEVLSAQSSQALPIVVGCETIAPELTDFPGVHIDNVAAAREATNYLISLGHRRIAFIYGTETSLLTKDREFGYRAAMARANLSIDDRWVLPGELTIEGAVRATRKLINSGSRPTALFCANDEMAMGALHECRSAGLEVPGDISVLGFDDIRYASVTEPPLTTVHQPAEEIGERVMYRLCREIEGEAEGMPNIEIVPHRLIIRESVAEARMD